MSSNFLSPTEVAALAIYVRPRAEPTGWHLMSFVDLSKVQRSGGAAASAASARCERCGQSLRLVFVLEHEDGRRATLGADCSTAIEYGITADAIDEAFSAERDAAERAEEARREAGRRSNEERMAKVAAQNLVAFGALIAQCEEIEKSAFTSEFEKALAKGIRADLVRGARNWGLSDERKPSGFCEADSFAAALVQARLPESKHLDAEVGARVTLTATLVSARRIESYSDFGAFSSVHTYRTDDGATLVWITSSAPAFVESFKDVAALVAAGNGWVNRGYAKDGGVEGARLVRLGERVYLTATVKAHKEYRGVKQTAITRAVISRTASAPKGPRARARARKAASLTGEAATRRMLAEAEYKGQTGSVSEWNNYVRLLNRVDPTGAIRSRITRDDLSPETLAKIDAARSTESLTKENV